jgi:non-ribosomal peptide synthetase component F
VGRADRGGLTYATSLFERATVERHLGYLRRVLEADGRRRRAGGGRGSSCCRRPSGGLVVEEWNRDGGGVPADACVHELFEAQVERTPDAVAVVFDGTSR